MANITLSIDVVSNFGFATNTNSDLDFFGEPIIVNWNSKNSSSYNNFNLGVLQTKDPYSNSIIYSGLPADSISIESFEEDLILANSFDPWSTPTTVWSPLPSGYIQKQLVDSSNNIITFPHIVPVSGNTPVNNIGIKVNTNSGELAVPTTVGTVYSAYQYAFRRMTIGYKIYSGGIAQTPTMYFMWYMGTLTN